MQFCDECGSMMHVAERSSAGSQDPSAPDDAEGDAWVCRSCGHESLRDAAQETTMTTTQGQSEDGPVDMSEVDDAEIGPTTKQACPQPDCDGERARYEMKQIRAADESETRFFTCVDCGHKWREDDH